MLTSESIWTALQDVKDPEIPVISLVEMGIVRGVAVDGDHVTITITPTFSGCPALNVMAKDAEQAVLALGAQSASVETIFAPPWSSDWITDEGRAKLKAFGLAPPHKHGGNVSLTFFDPVICPRCDSAETTLKNTFGSTLCRAIWTCSSCQETFEQFKAL